APSRRGRSARKRRAGMADRITVPAAWAAAGDCFFRSGSAREIVHPDIAERSLELCRGLVPLLAVFLERLAEHCAQQQRHFTLSEISGALARDRKPESGTQRVQVGPGIRLRGVAFLFGSAVANRQELSARK